MSARTELHSYVGRIERRLRLAALSRGAALVASIALLATVTLVLIASAFAFSEGSITGSRLALFATLAIAMLFGLGLPLWRVNRRRAVGKAEALFPAFQQRLVTFTERDSPDREPDPFVELLAIETLDVAAGAQPSAIVPTAMLAASVVIGIVSAGVLVWMITARPGMIGYGANLLWTGSQDSVAPLYDVRVEPGNVTLRRNTDQTITAQPVGILSPRVLLHARYQSAAKWEQVEMRPRSGSSSGYQFVLTGVPEDVEYYVEAGPRESKHFKIHVVDLPSVKQIKVTMHYPAWTGLKDAVEEHGGDLRALEGTRAELEVVTDKPLSDGTLALDDGQKIALADSGSHDNHYRGTIQLEKDGLYHVAAVDQGQQVRVSEDFFIEARKAAAPSVALARPGNDYRASPIEEVTLGVQAKDDYGLKQLDLHYSVNGGPDRTVHLLKQPGEKEASGSHVVPLEDLKLVPGDVISVYAEAKNGNLDTRTDMSFIQVDPFEREFSQSQQSGGGGGGGGGAGGGQPGEISRREKEMIATTFRQANDKKAAAKAAAEAGKFLSEAQSALRDQSLSLAGRLSARELTAANQEFSTFGQEMRAAADAMDPAARNLQQLKWQDAIADEQKALQHLLRAEATFRQIEVAFGARGGGGGGGGAGRDLANLFDLELDMEKNQYETQQSASSADQRSRDINDALKKLDELARRQEDLAQPHTGAQSFEQRWQQEMLQREAQELQRQIEQLTRNNAQRQGQQGEGEQGQQGQQSQGQQANGQQGQGQQSQGQQAQGRSGQGQQGQQGQGGQGQQANGQSAGGGQGQSSGQQAQGGQAGDQNGPAQAGRGAQGGRSGQNARNGQYPGQGGQGQPSQAEADARARSTQKAAEQALDRLRQAQDDMRRAAADPARAAEARRAAERLREASSLLGGLQSQEATSRLGSITREADRLVNEHRDQSDRVNRLKQRGAASNGDAQDAQATQRELSQLATDRQRLADDLTSLEQNMRNAARELDAGQRTASDKLRSAIEGADQSDLETHLQRTADWLRTGIDPANNGTESQIATDLQRLRDQVRGAQQALTAGGTDKGQGQQADDTEAALNTVDRLRRQFEGLRAQNQQPGQPGQPGQAGNGNDPTRSGQPQGQRGPAGQDYQTQSLSRDGGPGAQNGAQRGGQNQQGQQQGQGQNAQANGAQGGQQGGGQQGGGANGGQRAANGQPGGGANGQQAGGGANGPRGPIDGPVGQLNPGGGYRDGTVWDNVDIGNNARSSGRAAAAQATPQIDRQQMIQQGVTELNRLRQQAAADPEMQKQIQSLISAMEHLDPKRFPGNPAAIEELNQRLLAGIDTLELRLRRSLDDQRPGQIRTADPGTIPAGYEDAVAEYYRRLSGTAATTGASPAPARRGSK